MPLQQRSHELQNIFVSFSLCSSLQFINNGKIGPFVMPITKIEFYGIAQTKYKNL